MSAEHFRKELLRHESTDLQSKTMVIIHDACYGHRFSRPRTSKGALSTIVERPERLRAGLLGVAAAYVRTGQRYGGSPFAPHPDLAVDLLPPPPFQIRKTSRVVPLNSPAVTHVHGSQWMSNLKAMCDSAESRLATTGKELVRPKSSDQDEAGKLHEGDLYLCAESLDAFQGALGGVCEAVDAVFGPSSTSRAFVCIRPPGHHCSKSQPSGFCWLNNVHVGIAYAAMTHGLTHAAILDFDLHHGDGSQSLAWEQNRYACSAAKNAAPWKKVAIGYYSLHDINSYPCEQGDLEKVVNASACIDNAHGQSIWNVHLETWKTHEEFWQLYNSKYSILLTKARQFLRYHTERLRDAAGGQPPKAAIFLSAGFDASEWEGAGMQRHNVNVPTEFYARFTADVVHLAEEEDLGVDGRVISVLEGGYSDRALTSGVLSHLAGLVEIQPLPEQEASSLASEMQRRLGWDANVPAQKESVPSYDPEWWAPHVLQELEALAYPPSQPVAKKTQKGPTFLSPTQSSTAKINVAAKERRMSAEPASPSPLPEVDWATAANELWQVLVPRDRQTLSYRPEDLNAEASRARLQRYLSTEAAATPAQDGKRQLRERKPKPPSVETPKATTAQRPTSRSSRRTTISSVGDLPDPPMAGPSSSRGTSQASRRRSTANEVRDGAKSPTANGRPASRAGVTRKSRALSSTRITTLKRPVSPQKPPPLPKVPSMYLNAGSTENQGAATTEPKADADVKALSAGVKKLNIKLKVPSPEENARREAERERREAASRVTKTTPKATAKPQSETAETEPETNGTRVEVTPAENGQIPSYDGPADGRSMPLAAAGAEAEAESPGPSPSVAAAERRAKLPVFTSTSRFPFADDG